MVNLRSRLTDRRAEGGQKPLEVSFVDFPFVPIFHSPREQPFPHPPPDSPLVDSCAERGFLCRDVVWVIYGRGHLNVSVVFLWHKEKLGGIIRLVCTVRGCRRVPDDFSVRYADEDCKGKVFKKRLLVDLTWQSH